MYSNFHRLLKQKEQAMSTQHQHRQMHLDDYLNFELLSETKHELIDGEIVAMTGASANHNTLSLNIASELRAKLKGTDCQSFIADMKLKVGQDCFYPDVMLVCGKDNESEIYKTSPILIVEVLSKSTRKFDQTYKRLRYQNIPSLEEYVLIEQDKGEVIVFARKEHWNPSYYYLGDEVPFYSLGLTIAVEEIYYQVNNEDVTNFLQEKN